MKKNSKELLKSFVEKSHDPKCCLAMTDEGMCVSASGSQVLTFIAALVNDVKNDIPKKAIMEAVELAYLSDEELIEKSKNAEKETEKIKKLLDMLEELVNE